MHTSTTVSSEQNTHAKTRFESRQTDASSTPKQQAGLNHPLEAALGVKSSYVAKLHESLIKFLDDLAEKSIKLFSDYFYKDVKYQANFSDPAYLPKAIKQIGLVTLQTKDNVTECKDFKTLQTKLLADLEATRRRFTTEYFLPADNITRLALKRRFQLSICKLLSSAALGFIAELDIQNYPEHRAIMDLLSTSPSLLLGEPIAKTFTEFVLLYKEAHKLKFVPLPTIEHKVLTGVLNKINGHEERKIQILKTTTTGTTTTTINPTENNSTTTTTATTTPTELPADSITTTSTITTASNRTPTEDQIPIDHPTLAHHDHPILPLHEIILPPNDLVPPTPPSVLNPYPPYNLPLPTTPSVLNPYPPSNPPMPALPPTPNPYPNAELDTEWELSLTQPTENYANNNVGFPYCTHQPIDEEANKKMKLLTMLQDFVKNAIHAPLQMFQYTYTQTITSRRIQLATTPSILRTTAQRIAAAIQKEPPVSQPTLKGLITECTTKQTADLRLQVKSLQDQLKAQHKLKDDALQKRKPKDNTPQTIIAQDDTIRKHPKNAQGSSNLIWNRKFPARNSSNHAPADTQRFNQQTPKSNKRTHQQSQDTINTPNPRPTPTLNSTSTPRFTPRPNINTPTSANGNATTIQPNESTEPAKKRDWKHYGFRNGRK